MQELYGKIEEVLALADRLGALMTGIHLDRARHAVAEDLQSFAQHGERLAPPID